MHIAIIKDGIIEQHGPLTTLFPNVSHPNGVPSKSWLQEAGVIVVNAWRPYSNTEQLKPCNPYIEDGEVYSVQVEPKSNQQIQAELESLGNGIRTERNRRLAETDWRFRSDMNPSQDWVDYCQSLRDITQQTGFPSNVVWPVAPGTASIG